MSGSDELMSCGTKHVGYGNDPRLRLPPNQGGRDDVLDEIGSNGLSRRMPCHLSTLRRWCYRRSS